MISNYVVPVKTWLDEVITDQIREHVNVVTYKEPKVYGAEQNGLAFSPPTRV